MLWKGQTAYDTSMALRHEMNRDRPVRGPIQLAFQMSHVFEQLFGQLPQPRI